MYKPNLPFNVPMVLLKPEWKEINGVDKKIYPKKEDVAENLTILGSFRTFGGTETTVNGIYSVEKTANIETNYRPDILADCRIALLNSNDIYEIVGDPENIEMRNRFLKFKVKKISGRP